MLDRGGKVFKQTAPVIKLPPEATVPDGAIDGLKFSECLPREVGRHELSERLRDDDAARACLAEPVRFVIFAEEQDPRWIR